MSAPLRYVVYTLTADPLCLFFFFNDTATTEIYTLSLHDALPICNSSERGRIVCRCSSKHTGSPRSEEYTSELQSPCNLVCRLLLEKKLSILTLFCFLSYLHLVLCLSICSRHH